MRLALLAALTCATSIASAGVILSPTAVINNELGESSFTSPADIINQSGLSSTFTSGVTDFDAYDPTGVSHSNVVGGQWLGEFPPFNIPGGAIDFDLGSVQTITRFAFWNPNPGNGMADFNVYIDTASDFSSATFVGSYFAAIGSATGQVFDTPDVSGQFVRIEHNSFHGNRTGMGEIAFDAVVGPLAVPEPATVALLALSLIGAGYAGRRPVH